VPRRALFADLDNVPLKPPGGPADERALPPHLRTEDQSAANVVDSSRSRLYRFGIEVDHRLGVVPDGLRWLPRATGVPERADRQWQDLQAGFQRGREEKGKARRRSAQRVLFEDASDPLGRDWDKVEERALDRHEG
jgi:hypothetical protein